MPTLVRYGRLEDAAQINQIYNWYVENSTITFDLAPWTLARRQEWMGPFLSKATTFHLVVAEHHGSLAGFAYNAGFRVKAAYDSSTEVTVYTHKDHVLKGIGSSLFEKLFEYIEHTNLHRAYAGIALPNEASIRLHEKFGFEKVGLFEHVGTKFGRRIDVAWYQKRLDR